MVPELIKQLLKPELYPHPVDRIELIETHISWLILTGPFVYKIKKPVNFGFLDFTRLADRKFYCMEELRLNQRCSPALYDAVISVFETHGRFSFEHPKGVQHNESDQQPVEYAVRMHQFDPQHSFDHAADKGQITLAQCQSITNRIVELHRIADRQPPADQGIPELIGRVIDDNYLCSQHLTLPAPLESRLAALRQQHAQLHAKLSPLLIQRREQGFVRECHGDLHLGNITLYKNAVCLFDCIEFNQPFRWIDTISDLAFLLMDLEVHGLHTFANHCLNHYLEMTGDYESLALLRFYKTYRAMVRAKVSLLAEPPDLRAFERYLTLAEQYLNPLTTTRPHLLLMFGVSGCGKSYLSGQLVDATGAIRVRSDSERKRLHQQLSEQPEQRAPDLYGQRMNQLTFERLSALSHAITQNGYSVILDATFIRANTRQHYRELAQQQGLAFHIIECRCPAKLVRTRLVERQQAGLDISDADVAVMEEQLKYRQPLTPVERPFVITVDTTCPNAAEFVIKKLNLA